MNLETAHNTDLSKGMVKRECSYRLCSDTFLVTASHSQSYCSDICAHGASTLKEKKQISIKRKEPKPRTIRRKRSVKLDSADEYYYEAHGAEGIKGENAAGGDEVNNG